MPYIPHTEADKKEMLASIGVANTQALFDEIPAVLQECTFTNLPDGINEMALLKHANALAEQNQNHVCFIGAGSYEHHIPAAVWDIASRGEFLTSYTPYQAEASQGTLQLLYEFQTMIAELTGMEVANASMYDGSTAMAEAILMAARIQQRKKSHRILLAGTIHPLYRETVETIVRTQHIEVITLPIDKTQGITPLETLASYSGEDITALIIAQPNFFGCLEDVDAMTNWAKANDVISIACVNPVSLALLEAPGYWGEQGVDIVCGEGQPLGSPMASGGPYFGFLSTRMAHVRQMPGRLIGQTQDQNGQIGYSLTLQAREQHIRRGKATSNICTNQGLLVTAAAIHMSLLGATGLQNVAQQCYHNTHELAQRLTQIEGIRLAFTAPYFHEVLLHFDKPIDGVLQALEQAGIAGGYPLYLHDQALSQCLLVCATEMRTPEEIAAYVNVLSAYMTR